MLTFLTAIALSAAPAEQVELYIDRVPTQAEIDRNYTGEKFEPKVGCYLGAFLDLDYSLTETYKDSVGKVRRLPGPFETMVGKSHASYFYYMGYGSRTAKDWITKLGQAGKIVHIALEPNNGLKYVREDEYLINLAKGFAETKAPIFLRFASEMNGTWVNYHGDPKLYIEKFRLVHDVMEEYAPNVAMVWCPYATPVAPIKSYYPGDKYVDWVGVNLYSVTYYDQDYAKPAKDILPVDQLDYVYNLYSDRKPIMIAEYGAAHYSALEDKSTVSFAQKNLMSLYLALPRKYPRVKCINYFNCNNLTVEHRQNNNYAITQNPKMLAAYRNVVNTDYFRSSGIGTEGFVGHSDSFIPVNALNDKPQPTIFPKPMKARSREYIKGYVDFSAWIRDEDGSIDLRFLVDGRTFWVAHDKTEWRVALDTRKLKDGSHTIELQAKRHNKLIDSRKITIIVENGS